MPIKVYVKLNLAFLGLKVPNVGVLITEEPNQVLDKEHQTKLPGIVGLNLIWLSYNMFVKEHGTVGFESFKYQGGGDPLLFSQLCIYHHFNVQKNQTLQGTSKVRSQQV